MSVRAALRKKPRDVSSARAWYSGYEFLQTPPPSLALENDLADKRAIAVGGRKRANPRAALIDKVRPNFVAAVAACLCDQDFVTEFNRLTKSKMVVDASASRKRARWRASAVERQRFYLFVTHHVWLPLVGEMR